MGSYLKEVAPAGHEQGRLEEPEEDEDGEEDEDLHLVQTEASQLGVSGHNIKEMFVLNLVWFYKFCS